MTLKHSQAELLTQGQETQTAPPFASRPFTASVQPGRQPAKQQQDQERAEFIQAKFEATGLSLRQKHRILSPPEQQQLRVLQTKMDAYWEQRQERTPRSRSNLAQVSIEPTLPVQLFTDSRLQPIQRDDETQVQSPNSQKKKPDQQDAPEVGSQDVVYEILAHKMAYQGADENLGRLLSQWGYEKQWRRSIQGAGFFVGLLMPTQPEKLPVLAFKGTTPKGTGTGLADITADLDPIAVGFTAFKRHQSEVEELIGEAGGKVDVTGHSLGGALAQHAASAFPSLIRRVVTFQAPPISGSQALYFDKFVKQKPKVTHHIAKGDMVDTGGIAHLSGESYLHDPGGGLGSHSKFLLTSPQFKNQLQELGLDDQTLDQLGIGQNKRSQSQTPAEYSKTHSTSLLKRLGGELGRNNPLTWLVGGALFGVSSAMSQNDAVLGDDTIERNVFATAQTAFKKYKESALSRSFLGLGKVKGIKQSKVQKIINNIVDENPKYKSAPGDRAFENAASLALGLKWIVVQDSRIKEFSV